MRNHCHHRNGLSEMDAGCRLDGDHFSPTREALMSRNIHACITTMLVSMFLPAQSQSQSVLLLFFVCLLFCFCFLFCFCLVLWLDGVDVEFGCTVFNLAFIVTGAVVEVFVVAASSISAVVEDESNVVTLSGEESAVWCEFAGAKLIEGDVEVSVADEAEHTAFVFEAGLALGVDGVVAELEGATSLDDALFGLDVILGIDAEHGAHLVGHQGDIQIDANLVAIALELDDDAESVSVSVQLVNNVHPATSGLALTLFGWAFG